MIYNCPTMDLFIHDPQEVNEDFQGTAQKIQDVLNSFGISADVTEYDASAQKTSYFITPDNGVKVSKIKSLVDNFSLATGKECTVYVNNGKVCVDVPNTNRKMIRFGDFQGDFSGKSTLAIALGDNTVCDLAKMPHLLIAGTTGSGKSVCINSIIMSIIYQNHPDLTKMIMIDPKQVELTPYNGIPHLAFPVITDVQKAVSVLQWACDEMDRRYDRFSRTGVKDIDEYNAIQNIPSFARIVVIIDELADLMLTSKKAVEPSIVRLAQKARAAGIHLVIATQRPTRDVITGLIKANMPSRIAFKCLSGVDSRIILDQTGAEKLLGQGDMLYRAGDSTETVRLQGVYISTEEINRVCEHIKKDATKKDATKKEDKPEKKGFFQRIFKHEKTNRKAI